MFSFWRGNFGKRGEIGSCWSTPHTVTSSSDMLEDLSRCSARRVGGIQGLTLDTIPWLHVLSGFLTLALH